ncbi:MAG: DUF3788 domain-containing protein [Bacteroidales bacterium]|nr:DUF3788 domain-containing protein [Bacteroidales bacterium]
MEDISIFQDKFAIPSEKELMKELGPTYTLWVQIQEFIIEKYPKAQSEWSYPGKKYGWSFRIKDSKRAIIYLLPRNTFFKAAFVFGQKAYDYILESNISIKIKEELMQSKKYAEGRGIRIEIKNNLLIDDIKKLIEIKLAN